MAAGTPKPMHPAPALFEQHEIRRMYDEATETWWFAVIDILQVLIQQPDYQAARKYWKVLKGRMAKEGSQLVTDCYQLKWLSFTLFQSRVNRVLEREVLCSWLFSIQVEQP